MIRSLGYENFNIIVSEQQCEDCVSLLLTAEARGKPIEKEFNAIEPGAILIETNDQRVLTI